MMRLFLFLSAFVTLVNIHDFSLNYPDGTPFSLSQFSGKKILLVNISTGSSLNYQLRGLQELNRLYHDSLVVVGVPTNSFGTEPHSATEIERVCRNEFGTSYLITQPVQATGPSIHPIFSWLADGGANGAGSLVIRRDFQKFLFDKNGDLLGIYASGVDPLDSSIHKAILGMP